MSGVDWEREMHKAYDRLSRASEEELRSLVDQPCASLDYLTALAMFKAGVRAGLDASADRLTDHAQFREYWAAEIRALMPGREDAK